MSFKRFNKTICALSLAALYTVTTFGATVTDVTSSHWAYSSIIDLEKRGVMALNASGQFFPNQQMDYFEVADVLAKATGYVDGDVNKTADPALVAQIKANYEKQKPTLESYASKYTSWNSAYNQQVAYLLGRGYVTTADLDKFITKSGKNETKNIVTKEELSIFVVRMLGKAVTATESYTTTGFKDESSISVQARPYMAYLKKAGVLTPDAAGNGNGKVKVSKALCAKMIDSALQIKENTSVAAGNQTAAGSSTNTAVSGVQTAVVKKVLTKNTTEYYMLLQIGGNTSYYTIKNTTKILKADGSEAAITKLSGETLSVTLQMQGNTEYITSAKVVSTDAAAGTNTTVSNNANTSTNAGVENNVTGVAEEQVVTGTLAQTMMGGICRINLADGTNKTYILDGDCTITLNGRSAEASEVSANDTVIAYVKNSTVIKLQAVSGSSVQTTEGQILSKSLANNCYTFKVKQNGSEVTVTVPETAVVVRNLKDAELSDIRLGDTVSFTKTNGIISEVKAKSTRTKAEGTISQIIIGGVNQVVVNVNQTPVTYTIASDAEIYDTATAEVISVRDLHLGQKASLLLDSQEVISLDVNSDAGSVKVMGTIAKVGKKASYIDVLVDYDHVTGESKVYKRVTLNNSVKVALNGKSKDIYDLEQDMSIVLEYKYLDDAVPEKILIVK